MIQAILFDLDGTLIDTEHAAAQALHDCFAAWKLSVTLEDASYVTGRTWESAFLYLFEKYKIPVSEETARLQILKAYRESLEQHLIIVPGSAQAIQSLSAAYPLGLVSGSLRSDILWALRKLGVEKKFQVVLGAEDYPQSKPKPDGYLKAMNLLGVSPNSCLIFEDSTAGIAAAKAAGAWIVAVTSTNHFNQDLTSAHHHIQDLSFVNVDWVKNLSFD